METPEWTYSLISWRKISLQFSLESILSSCQGSPSTPAQPLRQSPRAFHSYKPVRCVFEYQTSICYLIISTFYHKSSVLSRRQLIDVPALVLVFDLAYGLSTTCISPAIILYVQQPCYKHFTRRQCAYVSSLQFFPAWPWDIGLFNS